MSARGARAFFFAILFVLLVTVGTASAQGAARVTTGFGLALISFPLPEGAVTAYITDDVAAGERFSGTLEGPAGFVLMLDDQRAEAGSRFHWRVPPGADTQRVPVVLVDPAGGERGRAFLPVASRAPREAAFRFPSLIQAGKPFPVRGTFDGNSRTTSVSLDGRPADVIAESMGKTVARAPIDAIGPTACTLVKGGAEHRRALRTLSIDVVPVPAAGTEVHEVTVKGLAGIEEDVPLQIGGNDLYLRASEVAASGTFSVQRPFPGAQRGMSAALVIPQSLRDEVAVILRTPQRIAGTSLARQHGDALRALDFDALPVAAELLPDYTLGGDAANAMVAADEARAMAIIFDSMPQSGLQTQLVGFTWFLDHPGAARAAAREGHDAALRVLRRVLSTATAQLALYVLGLTGSEADFPLLEQFYARASAGGPQLRDASEASLVRLASRPHMEKLRDDLTTPLPPHASYGEGAQVARTLRTAGLTGRRELVPAVCVHVADPRIADIDIFVDPGKAAVSALNAIVDGVNPPAMGTGRSQEEWTAYCQQLKP